MSTADRLLALEQGLWKGDRAVYEELLAEDALMAFPDPAGLVGRDAILSSVDRAPRWASVDITEPEVRSLNTGAMLLVYRAVARRAGETALYAALAASVYATRDGDWRLVFHQQTPVPAPPAA